MSVQISYNKKLPSKNSVNKVLFIDEKLKILSLKRFLTTGEYNVVSDLIKSRDDKNNFNIIKG